MNSWDLVALGLSVVGCVFFVAGSVGMLRLPDVFTRLHAATKADNLGLGLVLLGVALQSASPVVGIKLAFIWILLIISGATTCNLIVQEAINEGRFRNDADSEAR